MSVVAVDIDVAVDIGDAAAADPSTGAHYRDKTPPGAAGGWMPQGAIVDPTAEESVAAALAATIPPDEPMMMKTGPLS